MDYQEPITPKTVHIRYSSDFRRKGGQTFLAANGIEPAKENPAEFPIAGGVALKQLPQGWRFSEPKFYHKGTAKQYNPPNDGSCAICMQYETMRDKFKPAIKRLMLAPAHALDEKELAELIGFIPNYKDKSEFALHSASTKDLAGKRVLIVEGKNIAINKKFYWLYVSDPDVGFGTYTKIWFVATAEAWERHKEEAIKSIHSIEFR